MYFVLGMLSIIAAAFVAVIVWGLLKINKQQRMIEEVERELQARFAVLRHEIEDRVSTIHRHMDDIDVNHNRRMDHEHEILFREIADCRAYADSRFDKATGLTGAKQVIK